MKKPKFEIVGKCQLDENQVKLGNTTMDIKLLPLNWFVKRPVLVKAMRAKGRFKCKTPNGIVSGKAGDYIVIDVEGRAYPCKGSVFEKTHMMEKETHEQRR